MTASENLSGATVLILGDIFEVAVCQYSTK